MLNGISRAYLHSPCRGEVFVARCKEDKAPGEDPYNKTCWRLLKSMYGTRPAAQDWQHTVRTTLTSLGFQPGLSSANVFWHKKRDIWTMVHGDDFASSGELSDLRWLEGELAKTLLVKTEVLGGQACLKKEVRMLNRLIS